MAFELHTKKKEENPLNKPRTGRNSRGQRAADAYEDRRAVHNAQAVRGMHRVLSKETSSLHHHSIPQPITPSHTTVHR